MKNKLVAGLLGIFTGSLGLHRFYLGQIGLGILYLLFCWTFIPTAIGFIDGIIFLAMSEERFDRRFNSKYSPTAGRDVSAELEKLHELVEKGVLSPEEF